MPLYEYFCKTCSEYSEKIVGIYNETPIKCDNCNKKIERVEISKSNFHLKGGGWYKDGYGGNSNDATNGGSK